MKWKDWLESWGMTSITLNTGFADVEFRPVDSDRDAAWDLYIELLTRITTQYLQPDHGDEKAALDSIYALFDLTRKTLKARGRKCTEFARIAIIVLNQVVRPFTAKWHRASLAGAFDDNVLCDEFRDELSQLQVELRRYTKMLADMAGVEDLTEMDVAD